MFWRRRICFLRSSFVAARLIDARGIVSICYGFGDEHINKMLKQALRLDTKNRLIVVGNNADDQKVEKKRVEIVGRLNVSPEAVVVLKGTAQELLLRPDIADAVLNSIPSDEPAEF